MKLGDIIDPSHVILIDKKYKKNELIKILLDKLCQLDKLNNSESIYTQLLEREKLGSTAIGNGVAIPHVRISHINEPHVLICNVKQGVDFEASDKRSVKILFLLLTPDGDLITHLNLLARISHLAKDTDFVKKASTANDPNEMCSILIEEESKL